MDSQLNKNQMLSQLLSSYKSQINSAIESDMEQRKQNSELYNACRYALMNGGKRFRPALVMMIADEIGNRKDVVKAALAVEYFHTASLVVDDLPCMDNEIERRGAPSTHIAFNESTALLVSYALIAAGYENICLNTNEGSYSQEVRHLALTNVTRNMGLSGVTGGQYLDLFSQNPGYDEILEIIRLKTVTLFEIAFVLGWLFGGGPAGELENVAQAAHHFGMAFQIADDLGDVSQDKEHSSLNLALSIGVERAANLFHVELSSYRKILFDLKLQGSRIELLADVLLQSLSENSHV
ncbi:MAG: polyprenyl synthetase family protein [Chlamydiales bacterium]